MRKCLSATFLVILMSSSICVAQGRYSSDENCGNQYASIDKGILQFLYKIDGNLKEINKSKIKRIDYLNEVYRDPRNTKEVRKEALGELWTDADNWQYKVQSRVRVLIEKYERVNKVFGWDSYKKDADKFVIQLKGNSKHSFLYGFNSIRTMLVLDHDTRDFFEVLEEAERRLEQLGESSRLSKALNSDSEKYGYEIGFYKGIAGRLVSCQINYLEFAIDSR